MINKFIIDRAKRGEGVSVWFSDKEWKEITAGYNRITETPPGTMLRFPDFKEIVFAVFSGKYGLVPVEPDSGEPRSLYDEPAATQPVTQEPATQRIVRNRGESGRDEIDPALDINAALINTLAHPDEEVSANWGYTRINDGRLAHKKRGFKKFVSRADVVAMMRAEGLRVQDGV